MMILATTFKVKVTECLPLIVTDPEDDDEGECIGGVVKFNLYINAIGKPWQQVGTLEMELDDFEFFCEALGTKATVVSDHALLHEFILKYRPNL